jgi:hypothetical protein
MEMIFTLYYAQLMQLIHQLVEFGLVLNLVPTQAEVRRSIGVSERASPSRYKR